MTPAETFATIADTYRDSPGVSSGTGFGNKPGLRCYGRIFAMFIEDHLVVKLPADRCRDLCASKAAAPFEAGKGRPMKEWVSVEPSVQHRWAAFVAEAHAFSTRTADSRGC